MSVSDEEAIRHLWLLYKQGSANREHALTEGLVEVSEHRYPHMLHLLERAGLVVQRDTGAHVPVNPAEPRGLAPRPWAPAWAVTLCVEMLRDGSLPTAIVVELRRYAADAEARDRLLAFYALRSKQSA